MKKVTFMDLSMNSISVKTRVADILLRIKYGILYA